jgi:hypothetical protein
MPGTGAQGFMGVAIETTSGTYLAPTDFVPIDSEAINHVQESVWRRPIRQSADMMFPSAGNSRVEGDVSMDAYEDIVTIFLRAARTACTKTGTASPGFTYEFVGSPNAIPNKTLSITVVRNGIVFGYTGCVVGSFGFTIEDGALKFNPTILGRDEVVQSAPTATWPSGIQSLPYGAGKYKLEIPTATQVFDADGFDFNVDDSPEAQYRLKDTSTGAQFISYGERSVTLGLERDFESRADYDAFKILTSQSITMIATKGANNSITINVPAAIKDTYELGLTGQGDLTRASIAYNGVLDALGNAYKITTKCQKDVVVP